MRYHAGSEQWIPMEIKGVRGYFNDFRIDRDTVPKQLHFWELADGDSDGVPCRYKSAIVVNFYGTFITSGKLPIDDVELQEGFIHTLEDWRFLDSGCYSLLDIVQMEAGRLIQDSN